MMNRERAAELAAAPTWIKAQDDAGESDRLCDAIEQALDEAEIRGAIREADGIQKSFSYRHARATADVRDAWIDLLRSLFFGKSRAERKKLNAILDKAVEMDKCRGKPTGGWLVPVGGHANGDCCNGTGLGEVARYVEEARG